MCPTPETGPPIEKIGLPFGDSVLQVGIPKAWLGEIIQPTDLSPQGDLEQLIQTALDHPVGTPRVEHMVSPGQQIAILVDDHTRETPIRHMLSQLLERLDIAGTRAEDICIVLALGSHRALDSAEIEHKLGTQVTSHYEVINTPGSERNEFNFMGNSSNGIPVTIHRRVAEADVRIGLGMITPHMDAGFSGGAKILLPGVCSDQTVDAFHARVMYLQANPLGDEDAPLRMDLETAVGELAPLDFIVNTIPTIRGESFACVAGHPVQAQRAGANLARRVFRAGAARKYPVVLACCYPYEQDLWQSMKGLWCGELLTADTGSLVLLTSAKEGTAATPRLPEYIGADRETLIKSLKAGSAADLKSAATGLMVGRMKERIHISLVSPGLSRTEARSMGLSYFESVEAALEHGVKRLSPGQAAGCTGVIPHAGIALPVVDTTGLPYNSHQSPNQEISLRENG